MYRKISEALRGGAAVEWVMIVESHGSVPRGAGAAMAVFAGGACEGTIGGGASEHKARQMALEALAAGRSFAHEFSLAAGDAAELGMVCGGNMRVWFCHLAPSEENAAFFARVAAQQASPGHWLVLAGNEAEARWAAALVAEGQSRPEAATGSTALLGEGFAGLTKRLPVLQQQAPQQWRLGVPLSPAGRTLVFGAGHVAQQLVPILQQAHFACTVMDDRAEFACRRLFPSAQAVEVVDFETVLEGRSLHPADFVVIMTRGHISDHTLLRQALKTEAGYIGMIGSRNKVDTTFTRLLAEDGFRYRDLRRVHAPIGLPIGGETPEEIAVSIAAEMIACRYGRGGA